MALTLDKLVILGGRPLKGTVEISGAKNAALPLMAATLLAPGKFELENAPDLQDVRTMAKLLRLLGAQVEWADHRLIIDSSHVQNIEAPYELVKTMRASVYVLGPLLARFGKARVSLPGGCAIGPRPVNLHLMGMAKLGATIDIDRGYIVAEARRLRGSTVTFDLSSVGATGNLLMAAVLAEGETVIENAALEPEITCLAQFLRAMGACIEGIGTRHLVVRGVQELHPTAFTIIPDRIEAGTFLMAGALTGGQIRLQGSNPDHLTAVIAKLQDAGASVEVAKDTLDVQGPARLEAVDVTTAVYPGFPTDLQAQWMALMSVSSGSSVITETIFQDRFTHVAELARLGAQIKLDRNVAVVQGVEKLRGATVMSTDLRASASLVLAGLVAEGRTDVLRVYHLDRGYERLEEKLQGLGAKIWREAGTG